MTRHNLLLSKLGFGAILLFLVSSTAVFAQVNYTITGTLKLTSAPSTDPLGLDGKQVNAAATISQGMTPSSSSTTANSSTNTYTGVTVSLAGLQCSSTSNPPVAVTLTDNVGAPDTLSIENCSIGGIATIAASATLPDKHMITAVPASIPVTNLIAGSINFVLAGGAPGSFKLLNPTVTASGTPPPTVTPSIAFWSPPAVPVGSITPLMQQVTFQTSPAPARDAVSFTTSSTSPWLTVSPLAANTSSPITIFADPTGLTQPFNNGTVTLDYGQGITTQILVTLSLSPASVTLTGPPLMTFNYTLGATPPVTQQLAIGAASATNVNAAVTSGNSWLSVSPASATTPASFTVSVKTAGLISGVLNGNIEITSTAATNSPLEIPVTFNVTSSTLNVPSTLLTFDYTIGGTTPPAQSVNITGTSGINFTTSAATTLGGAWLSATQSGTVPASISVSANAAVLSGLTAGTYAGTVTVTSSGASGSPASIPVTLNVSAPTLTAAPLQLSFTYSAGGPAQPATQTITVSDPAGVNFTATPATTAGGAWLLVNPGSGKASGTLTVSVNTAGLTEPTYSGTITIAATGIAPQVVNVTLGPTGPNIAGIVSGASYDVSGFSPGAIATIFGTLLGPKDGVGFSVNSTGGLDDTLAGVVVTVDSIRAIPLFVSDGQVNIILPFNIGTSGQAKVKVQYNNKTSADFSIPLVPADVQIFTANASGSGPGSILNSDSTVNTAANPATKGTFISVFGTGGGALDPAVTVGGIAGLDLSNITSSHSATVAGENVDVQYAGTAPFLVFGVYQFNVILPADLPAGADKIILKVGDSQSQSNVTVFIK